MDCSASVSIAKIVIQFIENDINSKFDNKILFWHHYVNDILVFVNANYIIDVLAYPNSVCFEIQFTLEIEKN